MTINFEISKIVEQLNFGKLYLNEKKGRQSLVVMIVCL